VGTPDDQRPSRLPAWLDRPSLPVTIAFIASRAIAYAAGVRFDATPLYEFWQYVDPALLRARGLESLWYLHSQPPLFNAYLALVLKIFPGHEPAAFALVSLLLGWILALALYAVLERLVASRGVALALAIGFTVSPPAILYENWLFYDFPLAVLLVLATLCLLRFATKGRIRDAALFFALLAAIALTRSLFHVVWLVGTAGALVAVSRGARARVAAAATIPIALVLLWYGKNLVLFGTFSSSSWLGMSAARVSTFLIPAEERKQMVSAGMLSPYALIPPFSKLDAYRDIAPPGAPTGIPVLDQRTKQSGKTNFNNVAYIDISRAYLADASRLLRARPGAYLEGLPLAGLFFSLPASDLYFLKDNRARLGVWSTLWNRLVYGQLLTMPDTTAYSISRKTLSGPRVLLCPGYLLMAAFVTAMAGGTLIALGAAWGKAKDTPVAIVLVFLIATIAYATLVGNGLEVGENNRFRFMIDPLWLVLLGVVVDRAIQARARPVATGYADGHKLTDIAGGTT